MMMMMMMIIIIIIIIINEPYSESAPSQFRNIH